MIQPTAHPAGLVVLRSSQLAELRIPHGFSTRLGGVSTGPLASLNLNSPHLNADSPANLAENFQRFQTALDCPNLPRITVSQVHGSAVHVVADHVLPLQPVDADAMVTDQPGALLVIRIADCVPILLADRLGRAVAAVHAGWRGLVAGIIPQTIRTLTERYRIPPADLVAAVGPCISVRHFEVGPEVAESFTGIGLGAHVTHPHGPTARPHIDLPAAARTQLLKLGISDGAVDVSDACTFADARLFFSHRRDNGRTGRLAAAIALPVD